MRAHFPKIPCVVLPNPVMLPLPSKPPVLDPGDLIDPERKLLLTVGRLDPPKRQDLLIQAFADAVASDWELVVLGEGPSRLELEALTAKLGLAGRVRLPGFAGNLADWYIRADLFVLPSSYEGFPNALLEAAAHGTASIAFDVKAGPRDILGADCERGLLLPDDGTPLRHLADALKHLTQDHTARMELAARRTFIDLARSNCNVVEVHGQALRRANNRFTRNRCTSAVALKDRRPHRWYREARRPRPRQKSR